MKKILCMMLAVLLLVPTVFAVQAEDAEIRCYWATERELTDSTGSAVIFFTTHPKSEYYLIEVFRDGVSVGVMDAYTMPGEAEWFCEMGEIFEAEGSGTYTCMVSAVDEREYDPDAGIGVLAVSPMSNPYVYTEPTNAMLPVTNVRFENNAVYFDHDAQGMEATYEAEFYIEYGDTRGYSFFASSAYDKAITQDRYDMAMNGYEEMLAWTAENEPELASAGAPRIMIAIYAKPWDANLAKPSPKVYFYPNGEKATAMDEVPMPAWTVASNAKLSFAGSVSTLEAYNIKDNNYFKLRDIALKLTEMGYAVDVTWDADRNAINLITAQPYTLVGGELKQADGECREALPCDAKIYLNGRLIDLTAYTINGNNFFKLRDLCSALGINVGWDEAEQIIYIN